MKIQKKKILRGGGGGAGSGLGGSGGGGGGGGRRVQSGIGVGEVGVARFGVGG